MKVPALVLAFALPAAALAGETAPAPSGPGFHQKLFARYCEALRESPERYARLVQRLHTVYGYTYEDFARRVEGAPVVAECAVPAERVARSPARAEEATLR